MDNMITRSQIKAIGKRLRESQPDKTLQTRDLKMLNHWRAHHAPTLNYYATLLTSEASKLGLKSSEFTVTQRIKRVFSIILKLKRFPQMQLSTMDDVAGARIVLPSNREVSLLADALKEKKSKQKIKKLNNYIDHPKSDGYRSLHIVYEAPKTPSIQIEIQLRSHLQHCWATGVEIFGTLEKTSFKTGDGGKAWLDFFSLLSSRFAIKERTPVLEIHERYAVSQLDANLKKRIRDLNIIEQLNTYTSMYTSDWRQHRPKGRSGKYALITLDTKTNSTRVETFPEAELSQALDQYAALEAIDHSNDEKNMVLVNLDNMNNLEKAYPNYFMDTKLLSYYLSQIILGEF